MIYDKTCGNMRLALTEPSPSWVTIEHEGRQRIAGIQVEDLRDLRYLIDRALEAIKR